MFLLSSPGESCVTNPLTQLLPNITPRWFAVWQRIYLAWRKVALGSLMYSSIEPLIYMLGLGYGLGSIVGEIGGLPYIVFVATGSICFSAFMGASFEALYSAFARMHIQRTWEGILNAPVSLEDIVFAEWIFAACKATLAGTFYLIAMTLIGLVKSPLALIAIPVIFLVGLCAAGIAMIVTSQAKSYDSFSYYITLVITPMSMLCGVFFPIAQLPTVVQWLANALPLTHAVALVRPLIIGHWPENVLLHGFILLAYGVIGFIIATRLMRKRIIG
jgi:lipooligosaccharide transport system permease protein